MIVPFVDNGGSVDLIAYFCSFHKHSSSTYIWSMCLSNVMIFHRLGFH